MRKIHIELSIPLWVIHVAWLAAIATIAVVIVLKSGADINLTIGGAQQQEQMQQR